MYATLHKHPLNIDIDKGKCYFDVKSKLGLKTDDKRNIDFNAFVLTEYQMMKTR